MKTKSIIIVALLWAVTLGGIYFYVEGTKPQLAYVNLGELYNGFDLKSELEKKFEETRLARQNTLDSLRTEVGIAYQLFEQDNTNGDILQDYNMKRRQYEVTEQQFIEADAALEQELNDQIFSQMNEYISEFGKSQNHLLIYGANGSGALMYADEGIDITDDVIAYVNTKYEGRK